MTTYDSGDGLHFTVPLPEGWGVHTPADRVDGLLVGTTVR